MNYSIIIVSGFMGAGKTTLCNAAAETFGWKNINTGRVVYDFLASEGHATGAKHGWGQLFLSNYGTEKLFTLIADQLDPTVINVLDGIRLFDTYERLSKAYNRPFITYVETAPEVCTDRLFHRLIAEGYDSSEATRAKAIKSLYSADMEKFRLSANLIISGTNSTEQNVYELHNSVTDFFKFND